MNLPASLQEAVDRIVELSGLSGAAADTVRADLEQHFRDGLSAGRTPEQLLERFGDPEAVAPVLARHNAPAAPEPGRSGDRWLRTLFDDVRLAFRVLLKNPALATTVMIVLAIGVGANTVVFSVVNELLLRPLPVAGQSELVDVWADIPGANSFTGFSYQDFTALRDQNTVLEDLAAFSGRRFEVGEPGFGQEVVAQLVSDDTSRCSASLRRSVRSTSGEPPRASPRWCWLTTIG